MESIENSYGRLLLESQLPDSAKQLAQPLKSVVILRGKMICQRCHYQLDEEARLPSGAYYADFVLSLDEINQINCSMLSHLCIFQKVIIWFGAVN